MAEITLTIGGHSYPLSCGDGEEEALQTLARDIDARIVQHRALVGATDQSRELLMVALLLADELAEAHIAAASKSTIQQASELVDALDQRSTRLAMIANRLASFSVQAT